MTDTPAPTTPPQTPAAELAYAEAVAELEAILERLETDELDVDHLADRVGRAAALIRECRDRIASTRFEVDRIVTELQAPGAPTGRTDAQPPPDDPPF